MGRMSNCCTLAPLVLLALVCFSVRTRCEGEPFTSLCEPEADSCLGGDKELKRFDDGIDYDTFVSLMGRRSAGQPNRKKNTSVPRKRSIRGILAELLGRTKVFTDQRMIHRSQ